MQPDLEKGIGAAVTPQKAHMPQTPKRPVRQKQLHPKKGHCERDKGNCDYKARPNKGKVGVMPDASNLSIFGSVCSEGQTQDHTLSKMICK
jgi:hypothetical protein